MAHRKSKGTHKKHKTKKHEDKKNRQSIYQIEEANVEKAGQEVYGETIMGDSLGTNATDIHAGENLTKNISDTNVQNNPIQATIDSSTNDTEKSSTSGTNDNSESTTNADTNENASADLNNLCEEIKAKQQELFNRLKNLSEALSAITLIRDDVNSLTVDTLTELYFTRQVRPLLDALNIIAFSSTNISATATAFQTSAFSDTKEIKNALKLSYKMNDEVDDIINALGRRLAIFLKLINNMDKNCPPFNFK